MDFGIAGRCALVTGGSLGIGRACAEHLAAEGVDVAIVARDGERATDVAGEIARAKQAKVVAIAADLSRPEGVARAVAEAGASLGRIDILINNAGSAPIGRLQDLDDATWQDCFDLKLMGYVRCARAVIPDMRARRWGRVVNIIGRGGHYPSARYLAGGAINAALLNITQALAEECGPDNVLVNGINPGATATPRQQTLVAQKAKLANRTVEEIIAESATNIPLGRIGQPDDVAALATYLCSEPASFINGALMEVDGGASRTL